MGFINCPLLFSLVVKSWLSLGWLVISFREWRSCFGKMVRKIGLSQHHCWNDVNFFSPTIVMMSPISLRKKVVVTLCYGNWREFNFSKKRPDWPVQKCLAWMSLWVLSCLENWTWLTSICFSMTLGRVSESVNTKASNPPIEGNLGEVVERGAYWF